MLHTLVYSKPHDGIFSSVSDAAVVGGSPAGAEHAGVGSTAVEPHGEQVALTVVGRSVIHYLSGETQSLIHTHY